MPHLLVIEEVPEIQHYLDLVLHYAGYAVTATSSLPGALALAAPAQPHAIILNLGYAYADPETPLSLLQAHLPSRHVPVIAISARPDLHREELRALGYADFIAKPFHLQTLLACLEEVLLASQALG